MISVIRARSCACSIPDDRIVSEEVNGARWPSRSSKSVAARDSGRAGFDSQALPPPFAHECRRRVPTVALRAKVGLVGDERAASGKPGATREGGLLCAERATIVKPTDAAID